MANASQAPSGHERIETSNFLMIVLIVIAVAIGGIVGRAGPLTATICGWGNMVGIRRSCEQGTQAASGQQD